MLSCSSLEPLARADAYMTLIRSINAVSEALDAAGIDDQFPVTVNGEVQQSRGREGMAETMAAFMDNPAFNGAREGTFRSDCRVAMQFDAQGKPHITILGYDFISFEPDEAMVARDAFQLVRSSDLALDAASAPPEVIEAVENGKFRRREDLLSLHRG